MVVAVTEEEADRFNAFAEIVLCPGRTYAWLSTLHVPTAVFVVVI